LVDAVASSRRRCENRTGPNPERMRSWGRAIEGGQSLPGNEKLTREMTSMIRASQRLRLRCKFGEPRSATTLAYCCNIERAVGERSQELGFRLGQVNPGGPILRTKHHDLAVMIGSDVRSRRCRQLVNVGGWLPCASLQSPAIAVIGDPFKANRCLALGYFLPVNSKNAEAGMRHRLLLAKCRPSERKLKTGAPPGRPGGKLKVMGTSSTSSPAARITGPVSLILMSSACGRSSSLCRPGILSSRACIILQ
jgi:hypothetical protein